MSTKYKKLLILNLPYVIKAIAELKNLSEEEVLRATYENAKRIYRIND